MPRSHIVYSDNSEEFFVPSTRFAGQIVVISRTECFPAFSKGWSRKATFLSQNHSRVGMIKSLYEKFYKKFQSPNGLLVLVMAVNFCHRFLNFLKVP
jgi:hypothetical protein